MVNTYGIHDSDFPIVHSVASKFYFHISRLITWLVVIDIPGQQDDDTIQSDSSRQHHSVQSSNSGRQL